MEGFVVNIFTYYFSHNRCSIHGLWIDTKNFVFHPYMIHFLTRMMFVTGIDELKQKSERKVGYV
ncbi:hypothetical protein [Paracerasibacillus soli]|uniref:Uncharacterized protein n=1 Tax=Paracerasibacillus soli TaxID=480284 RepID=A0ABU5CW33_9BACI|nr:hypothetical protein [Virgibacillus soli]MDY0410578.1 hypothetical protein [Virgibacillus soli]